VGPRLAKTLGGDNGYALRSYGTVLLPGNPFIYPDNLPRVNAKGGPEGRPGCWQKVTKDLWPFPYLVMDTGLSIAPYNHFEIATPWTQDYIWAALSARRPSTPDFPAKWHSGRRIARSGLPTCNVASTYGRQPRETSASQARRTIAAGWSSLMTRCTM
jgi:hypothetical protein